MGYSKKKINETLFEPLKVPRAIGMILLESISNVEWLGQNSCFSNTGKRQTQQLCDASSDLTPRPPTSISVNLQLGYSVRSPHTGFGADCQTLTQGCSQIPEQVHTHHLFFLCP